MCYVFRKMLFPVCVCLWYLQKVSSGLHKVGHKAGNTDYHITRPDQRAVGVACLDLVHIRPWTFEYSSAHRGFRPPHCHPGYTIRGALEIQLVPLWLFEIRFKKAHGLWLTCLQTKRCYWYVLTSACCSGALCFLTVFSSMSVTLLSISLKRISSSNTLGTTFCTSKWSCVWQLSWTILPQRRGPVLACRTTMGSLQHPTQRRRGRQWRQAGPVTHRPPSTMPLWHM